MSTAVYNKQSLGSNADVISLSPIDVRIESEATPEEISRFLISLAALIGATSSRESVNSSSQDRMEAEAYYRNKFGDEFAYEDNFGFESSHMGARADQNHIF